jgi:hypothetical protein
MPRVHLPELEDQAWFPRVFRDAMTDYLGFAARVTPRVYAAFLDRLLPALERTGARHIVDLGSGSGVPAQIIAKQLAGRGVDVDVTLTDLYPNVDRLAHAERDSGGRVRFHREPVDATAVQVPGFRTMVNAFHHLRPEIARRVLADAVAKREGIAVLELVERHPGAMLGMFFVPLTVLLATPFIRPARLASWFFTYVVPVVPLASFWDGMCSCWRVYSPDELRELVGGIDGADGYTWTIERVRVLGAPGKITVLVGAPA